MKPNLQLTINTLFPILRLLPLLGSLASHFHGLPVKVVRKLLPVLASVADIGPRLDEVTDGEVSQLQIAVRRWNQRLGAMRGCKSKDSMLDELIGF